MTRTIPHPRAANALLALVIFVSWLGGEIFHNHAPTAAPCKVCQALQANQAELPAEGAAAARPTSTSERIVAAPSLPSTEALLLVPQGRAPPPA